MNDWAWVVLALSVQWIMILFFPNKIEKGRILTRPFYRLVRPPWTRFSQIVMIWGVYEVCRHTHVISHKHLTPLYWGAFVLLYLDDYLTGDDDKWKKFWDAVKNKIKWLMKLPQPEPIPETAE